MDSRDGKPVAELRPVPGSRLSADALVDRFRRLPPIDAARFRDDVDAVVHQAIWTMDAGILDTNTVILLERLDPADLPAEPVISVITLGELSVGPLVADDDQERAARQVRLQEVESVFEPLPFDAAAARAFGRVAASLRHPDN